MWVTVKPHAVGRVLREVAPLMKKDHIIVSAAAGVTIKALEKVILICETVSAVSELNTLYSHCVFAEQEQKLICKHHMIICFSNTISPQ